MEYFEGQNALGFADRIKTDNDCLEYLAEMKWQITELRHKTDIQITISLNQKIH